VYQTENRRIVVVDDEQCIADTLALIFRSSGYDAAAYYDGRSALEACRFSHPDLLLTDVTMPGISGIELAILIRRLCPGCRILLFSGLSGNFERVQQAERDGHYFEILEKPVHPTDLLRKVAAAFNEEPALQFRRPGVG
jgi:DNA-binding NtrC family response regulator